MRATVSGEVPPRPRRGHLRLSQLLAAGALEGQESRNRQDGRGDARPAQPPRELAAARGLAPLLAPLLLEEPCGCVPFH